MLNRSRIHSTGSWNTLRNYNDKRPLAATQSTPEIDRGELEISEVHPAILGGSPTDPTNKILLTRNQHIAAVRYWNRIIRDLRSHRE